MDVGVATPSRIKTVPGREGEQYRGRAGDSAPYAPEIIYCTAVAEPVGLLPEPAAGRADAKAARHGRPTAAPKR